MCNINKKTKLKTKTVYKVVWKHNGDFYSVFTLKKLSLGKVKPLTKEEARHNKVDLDRPNNNNFIYFDRSEYIYNQNMINKVSGFERRRDAEVLKSDLNIYGGPVILRAVLVGTILKGTGDGIRSLFDGRPDVKTYAGTEILSMEEV
jgi:hypothetical protein